MVSYGSFQSLCKIRPISFLVFLPRGGDQGLAGCSAAGPPQVSSPRGETQTRTLKEKHITNKTNDIQFYAKAVLEILAQFHSDLTTAPACFISQMLTLWWELQVSFRWLCSVSLLHNVTVHPHSCVSFNSLQALSKPDGPSGTVGQTLMPF